MIKFYLPLFCILTIHVSNAQVAKSQTSFTDRNWFSMTVGSAIPLGDFASDDLHNSAAGFARGGFVGRLDLGIKLYRSLGLCFTGVGGKNKFNVSAIEGALPTYNGVSKKVSSSNWKYVGGMGGLYMTAPVGRAALVLKGQVGIASVQSASLEISMSNGYNSVWSKQYDKQANTMMVNFGMMGIVPLAGSTFLNLGVDYMSMSPTFDDVNVTSSSSSGQAQSHTYDLKMEMKWVNLNAGLLWQF